MVLCDMISIFYYYLISTIYCNIRTRTKVYCMLLTFSDDIFWWKKKYVGHTVKKNNLWFWMPVSTRWLTASHSPQTLCSFALSCWGCWSTRKVDDSTNDCICRFQTEMATKREKLWTAALTL